jgi:hypothetical protein
MMGGAPPMYPAVTGAAPAGDPTEQIRGCNPGGDSNSTCRSQGARKRGQKEQRPEHRDVHAPNPKTTDPPVFLALAQPSSRYP